MEKLIWATVVGCAASLALAAQTQERSAIRIAVNDPRPVAAAAESLERRLGWVVTYEDPQWVAASDMQDVTEAVRGDLAGTPNFLRNLAPRVYVPKGGRIDFEVPRTTAGAQGFDRVNFLNDVLQAHSTAGNPGRFRLQEGTSGRLHIVPLAAKDRSERVAPQRPVLDWPVSLEWRQYQGLEFLAALADAVTRATGVPVEIGTTPLNTLAHHSGAYGAGSEPARSVLARFLDGVGPGYSWQLFFDPADRKYFLNIHWVSQKGAEE